MPPPPQILDLQRLRELNDEDLIEGAKMNGPDSMVASARMKAMFDHDEATEAKFGLIKEKKFLKESFLAAFANHDTKATHFAKKIPVKSSKGVCISRWQLQGYLAKHKGRPREAKDRIDADLLLDPAWKGSSIAEGEAFWDRFRIRRSFELHVMACEQICGRIISTPDSRVQRRIPSAAEKTGGGKVIGGLKARVEGAARRRKARAMQRTPSLIKDVRIILQEAARCWHWRREIFEYQDRCHLYPCPPAPPPTLDMIKCVRKMGKFISRVEALDVASRRVQQMYRGHQGRVLFLRHHEMALVSRLTLAYHAEHHAVACGYPGCHGINLPERVAAKDRLLEHAAELAAVEAAKVAVIVESLSHITRYGWTDDWDRDKGVPMWFRTPIDVTVSTKHNGKGAGDATSGDNSKEGEVKDTDADADVDADANAAKAAPEFDEVYDRPIYVYPEYVAAVAIQRIARGQRARKRLYLQKRARMRQEELEGRRAEWAAGRPQRDQFITLDIHLMEVADVDGTVTASSRPRAITAGVHSRQNPATGQMVRHVTPVTVKMIHAKAALARVLAQLDKFKIWPWVLQEPDDEDEDEDADPVYVREDTNESCWEPEETANGKRLRGYLRRRIETQRKKMVSLEAEKRAEEQAARDAINALCQRSAQCSRGKDHRGRCNAKRVDEDEDNDADPDACAWRSWCVLAGHHAGRCRREDGAASLFPAHGLHCRGDAWCFLRQGHTGPHMRAPANLIVQAGLAPVLGLGRLEQCRNNRPGVPNAQRRHLEDVAVRAAFAATWSVAGGGALAPNTPELRDANMQELQAVLTYLEAQMAGKLVALTCTPTTDGASLPPASPLSLPTPSSPQIGRSSSSKKLKKKKTNKAKVAQRAHRPATTTDEAMTRIAEHWLRCTQAADASVLIRGEGAVAGIFGGRTRLGDTEDPTCAVRMMGVAEIAGRGGGGGGGDKSDDEFGGGVNREAQDTNAKHGSTGSLSSTSSAMVCFVPKENILVPEASMRQIERLLPRARVRLPYTHVGMPYGWEVAGKGDNGESYFCHKQTEETTWEKPQFTLEEDLAARMVQVNWRGKAARRLFKRLLASVSVADLVRSGIADASSLAWIGYRTEGMTAAMWLTRLGLSELVPSALERRKDPRPNAKRRGVSRGRGGGKAGAGASQNGRPGTSCSRGAQAAGTAGNHRTPGTPPGRPGTRGKLSKLYSLVEVCGMDDDDLIHLMGVTQRDQRSRILCAGSALDLLCAGSIADIPPRTKAPPPPSRQQQQELAKARKKENTGSTREDQQGPADALLVLPPGIFESQGVRLDLNHEFAALQDTAVAQQMFTDAYPNQERRAAAFADIVAETRRPITYAMLYGYFQTHLKKAKLAQDSATDLVNAETSSEPERERQAYSVLCRVADNVTTRLNKLELRGLSAHVTLGEAVAHRIMQERAVLDSEHPQQLSHTHTGEEGLGEGEEKEMPETPANNASIASPANTANTANTTVASAGASTTTGDGHPHQPSIAEAERPTTSTLRAFRRRVQSMVLPDTPGPWMGKRQHPSTLAACAALREGLDWVFKYEKTASRVQKCYRLHLMLMRGREQRRLVVNGITRIQAIVRGNRARFTVQVRQAQMSSDWEQLYNDEYKEYYYFNNATRASSWEAPENGVFKPYGWWPEAPKKQLARPGMCSECFDEKATMLCNECVVERVVKGKALRPARLGFCFTCYVTSHGNDREKMSHTKTIIAPLKAKSLTCIECDGLATVRFGENMYREHVQRH